MGHAFCLTRLVMCCFFSLSSLRPDIRSKEHASLFCLLASISLRITWVHPVQKTRALLEGTAMVLRFPGSSVGRCACLSPELAQETLVIL